MSAALAVMGHNQPPSDAELLQQKLEAGSVSDVAKMNEILAFKIPEKIENEEEAKVIADFIDKIKTQTKAFEKSHKKEKESFLELGRVVDKFFKGKISLLDDFLKEVSRPVNTYLTAKAEKARQELFEREEQNRLKAETLAEQAQAHHEAGIEDTAQQLLNVAVQTEERADAIGSYAMTAKSASLANVRTASGVKLAQRTRWVGEPGAYPEVDLNAIKQYFTEEHIQTAINKAVRDGVRQIPGVRIYQKAEI